MVKYLVLIFIALTAISTKSIANNNVIDSLKQVVATSINDTNKIDALNNLSEYYIDINKDSAYIFANQAIELSKNKELDEGLCDSYKKLGIVYLYDNDNDNSRKYIKESLILATRINDNYRIANAYYLIGATYYYSDIYDKALENYKTALYIAEENGYKDVIENCYNVIGILKKVQGKYDEAIEYYLKSLKLAEEERNLDGVADLYNNIGLIYTTQGLYIQALNYFNKSLQIAESNNNRYKIVKLYSNIGLVYENEGKYDTALKNYNKSLKVANEIDYKGGISNALGNIGNILKHKGLYKEAIVNLNKALLIRKELNDKEGIALSFQSLGEVNLILADSVAFTKSDRTHFLSNAITFSEKAFTLSDKINIPSIKLVSAITLKEAYKKLGNSSKALEYLEIYTIIHDSIFNREKFKAIAELEKKYNKEKDQLLIEQFKKDLELRNEKVKKQQLENLIEKRQKYALALILLFSILTISYIILRLRKNKKISKKIKEQYLELVKQNIKITTKNKEIEKQKEVIAELVKQFEDTINNLEDVYFKTDRNFIYQQVSPSILKHIKLDNINQIIGKPLTTYWDITKNEIRQIRLKIFKEKYIRDFIFNYKTSDGETKYAKVNARAIYKNKQFLGVEGIIRDVTKEIKLKEIEDDYKKILNSTTDVIFLVDKTGKIIYVNDATIDVSGHMPEDVIGKNITLFAPLIEVPKYLSKIKQVFVDKTLPPFETIIKDKNGIYIPVEVSGEIIKYKGKTVGLASYRDITDRKIAEQALKEKTEKYELLTNTIDDFIWMVDLKMQLMYISPSCKKLTGYTEEEIEKLGIPHLHTRSSLEILNITIAKALASSNKEFKISIELDYVHKNGDIINTQVIGHIVYNKNNEKIGFAAISRKINKK